MFINLAFRYIYLKYSFLTKLILHLAFSTLFYSVLASISTFMASLVLPFFFTLLFYITPSTAKSSPKIHALVLPVIKDPSTLQYLTTINQRTPLTPIKLTLDLGGRYLWVDCEKNYISTTYSPAHCGSAECTLANSTSCGDCYAGPIPGCNNNMCSDFPDNQIHGIPTPGEFAKDIVSIQSTDGKNPGPVLLVPQFVFLCGSQILLDDLASGVTGMAGLGRTTVSIPSQFANSFGIQTRFAICLSSTTKASGVMFFGEGPYVFLPRNDVSKRLTYTKLIINPVSTAALSSQGEPSADYFIQLQSIKINGKPLAINSSLLSINKEGYGGTKISTIHPYTVMETSIYKSFTRTFIEQLAGIPLVPPVAPFKTCYSSKSLGSTRVGPGVPPVELVMKSKKKVWMIFGSNSMVSIGDDVVCLGFVDGGENARSSKVIGGHQIEDNLLEFDLKKSRLGFSSSLLFQQTTCANFNFTSK